MRSRFPLRPLFLLEISALLAGAGCSRKKSAAAPAAAVEAAEPGSAPKAIPSAPPLPEVGGVSGYVGSENCRACHQDQYASWHRTYHRTMTQFANARSAQANFNHVVLTNENGRFILRRQSDQLWVHMEKLEAPDGNQSAAETMDAPISLITGSHHMQVFWVPAGHGNVQIGFPFTWLIPEQRWVPRNETFVRPPGTPHSSEVWNVVCSRCHATGVEPRVDPQARTVDTRVAELGIACEACHGPGQRHVQARRAAARAGQTAHPSEAILRREIVHPKKIAPARASQICGFCHSMKWFDRASGWPGPGFSFRPGDDLEKTTPIIQPSRAQSIPGLAKYLQARPSLLRDFFWPDGMIRVSGREYNGLLASPCYRGGKFSCLSCHSLHESDPDGLVADQRKGNGACTQCHGQYADERRLTAHTRHASGSAGSLCYNCHMPFTTYGVLKAIRSHQISSPNAADELAAGRPNACNLCHLDKSLAWTANYLARWFHQAVPPLRDGEKQIADSTRLALAGNAGQRALIAWHFGWTPARSASGSDWIAPVLAALLDDPYAAVRCVAQRALRRSAPALLPAGYDYTISPETRPPAESQVWRAWRRQLPRGSSLRLPAETLVQLDSAQMKGAFARLARQRDQQPVRLRE